jgi:hypothetical protein
MEARIASLGARQHGFLLPKIGVEALRPPLFGGQVIHKGRVVEAQPQRPQDHVVLAATEQQAEGQQEAGHHGNQRSEFAAHRDGVDGDRQKRQYQEGRTGSIDHGKDRHAADRRGAQDKGCEKLVRRRVRRHEQYAGRPPSGAEQRHCGDIELEPECGAAPFEGLCRMKPPYQKDAQQQPRQHVRRPADQYRRGRDMAMSVNQDRADCQRDEGRVGYAGIDQAHLFREDLVNSAAVLALFFFRLQNCPGHNIVKHIGLPEYATSDWLYGSIFC